MLYESPKIKYFRDWLGLPGEFCSDGTLNISTAGVLAAIQSAYSDLGLIPKYTKNIRVDLLNLAEKGEIEKLVYQAIVFNNRDNLPDTLEEFDTRLEEEAS